MAPTQLLDQPSCAICSTAVSDYRPCPHESDRLHLAIMESRQRWLDGEMIESITYGWKWVTGQAQEQIINTFNTLVDRRQQERHNQLVRIPLYNLYKQFGGRHPRLTAMDIAVIQSAIARADFIYRSAIDQDWIGSVQLYPQVLDYYWSLIRVRHPPSGHHSLLDPVFVSNGVVRRRSRGRRHSMAESDWYVARSRSRSRPPSLGPSGPRPHGYR